MEMKCTSEDWIRIPIFIYFLRWTIKRRKPFQFDSGACVWAKFSINILKNKSHSKEVRNVIATTLHIHNIHAAAHHHRSCDIFKSAHQSLWTKKHLNVWQRLYCCQDDTRTCSRQKCNVAYGSVLNASSYECPLNPLDSDLIQFGGDVTWQHWQFVKFSCQCHSNPLTPNERRLL